MTKLNLDLKRDLRSRDLLMHVHTAPRSGDSHLTPQQAILEAEKANADFLLFTEHEVRWTREELDALKNASQTDLIILGSLEIAHRDAHLILVNFEGDLDIGLPIEKFIGRVHSAGGAVILAHPADVRFQIPAKIAAEWEVDAVEVINSQKRCMPEADWDQWLDCDIALVAGMDAHSPLDFANIVMTQVPAWIECESDLADALLQRQVKTIISNTD